MNATRIRSTVEQQRRQEIQDECNFSCEYEYLREQFAAFGYTLNDPSIRPDGRPAFRLVRRGSGLWFRDLSALSEFLMRFL